MGWLPVMLRLDGALCVVIGGGAVAERKVLGLLEADAFVTLISPTVTGKLEELAEQGVIHWVTRDYAEGDLSGATLAFAATNDGGVNGQVAAEAQSRGVLVNVADDADAGTLMLTSVLRRGKLMLSVSTMGASPSTARRVRRELEEAYGDEYEVWLDWLAEVRLMLRQRVEGTELRQLLHRLLDEMNGPELLRTGRLPASGWQEAWLEALRREPVPDTVWRLASQV
ncbi:bifunctional precorrin-2 dehydrogenase/sirohydrochlorin ferrochelatase [Paenibacillus chartarius]|uniref:precorrin-2 dehydrogenase n=1 Tax=Paenibacillus chartarius TaxID=747481 RepID=A0ABV6DJ54_9BACL